jgi:hypothetical protein
VVQHRHGPSQLHRLHKYYNSSRFAVQTRYKLPNMSEKETVGTDSAAAPVEATPNTSTDAHYVTEEPTGDIVLPKGWKYRGRRIAGINIPWYASPKIQLGMVAFVCFLFPGMFNALDSIGGVEKTGATLADNMVSFIPHLPPLLPKTSKQQP